MITIAHIDNILQLEHILEDFFYEDSINGMPALIHEEENMLMSLYLKEEILFLYVQELTYDMEWNIALCDADEDVADFLQDLPSALFWITKQASGRILKAELSNILDELSDAGFPADHSYEVSD